MIDDPTDDGELDEDAKRIGRWVIIAGALSVVGLTLYYLLG